MWLCLVSLGFDARRVVQAEGIQVYAFRHEQSAAYAASAYGYLVGEPGVCLCVAGPGVVHSLSGLANARANNWPFLLVAGSHRVEQNNRGAFQDGGPSHSAMVAPYVKASAVPVSYVTLPTKIERVSCFPILFPYLTLPSPPLPPPRHQPGACSILPVQVPRRRALGAARPRIPRA